MDYVREHIKRYWGITYRRTLGISLVTFSVAIAICLTFTVLTEKLAVTSYLSYLIFWFILLLAAALIFVSNFFTSHVSSVKLMREDEHKAHSTHMARWMIVIVVGAIAFFLPLLFANIYMEPIMMLFTLGGVFLVLYGSIAIIFKHKYGELAIGGIAFWFMFVFGLYALSNAQLGASGKSNFSLYLATMSITIITGFVGLALIFNSSTESMHEFLRNLQRIEEDEVPVKRVRRKTRRVRRA